MTFYPLHYPGRILIKTKSTIIDTILEFSFHLNLHQRT